MSSPTLTPSLPVHRRTRIKICGLTREQDVDAAVHAGADAIGFVLYPASARAVTAQRAAQLARRLPPFVTPVLLFVNALPAEVQAAAHQVPGAWLQFHGDETPEDCWRASDQGRLPYLRAARIPLGDAGRDFNLLQYAQQYSQARALLLDALVDGYGGGGQTFHWSHLPPSVPCHLVLSGGLTPENVGDGIAQLQACCPSLAVDVSSGVEAHHPDGSPRKGIKDCGKIQQFVAAVRAADTLLA